MPYESSKQRRFFKMCEHSPSHARGKCPDAATLKKFSAHDDKSTVATAKRQLSAVKEAANGR